VWGEARIKAHEILGNKFLVGIAEIYGPHVVAEVGREVLGYPAMLATTHSEAIQIQTELKERYPQ